MGVGELGTMLKPISGVTAITMATRSAWPLVQWILSAGLCAGSSLPAMAATLKDGNKVEISQWNDKHSFVIEASPRRIDDDRKIDLAVSWKCSPATQRAPGRAYEAADPQELDVRVIGVPFQTVVDLPKDPLKRIDSWLSSSAERRAVSVEEWFNSDAHIRYPAQSPDEYKFVLQHSAQDFLNRNTWNIQFPIGGVQPIIGISLKNAAVRGFLARCEEGADNLTKTAEFQRKTDGPAAVAQGNSAFQKGDYQTARQAYLKADDLGFSNAWIEGNLGWMFLEGHGGERDYSAGWRWFEASANKGSAYSQYHMGRLEETKTGWLTSPDYKEAERWYRLSADQDYTPAQGALANLYSYATDVKDDVKALQHGLQAEAKGDPEGQYVVGFMYAYGRGGVAAECALGVTLLQTAGSKGIGAAFYALGKLSDEQGTCSHKDPDQARKWMEMAAAAGSRPAGEWLKQHETKSEAQRN